MSKNPGDACACEQCTKPCKYGNPGWFMPGEAAKAAAYLGLKWEAFRDKYLILDYWIDDEENVEVWAPIKVGPAFEAAQAIRSYLLRQGQDQPGGTTSWGYPFSRGRCTFLDEEDRCIIHAAKPYECRQAMMCEDDKTHWRKKIVAAIVEARSAANWVELEPSK